MSRRGTSQPADPFRVLGLPARAGLADDDVRAAWRRIAAATHPDRADGGDPERFAVAAAAYTLLRTRSGRGEALADLTESARIAPGRSQLSRVLNGLPALLARAGSPGRRVRRGRPGRLALRAAAALAGAAAAIVAAGLHPAAPALVTGVLTWFALTARHDLAPPGSTVLPRYPGTGPVATGRPGSVIQSDHEPT
jgi:hypothetical protein